MVENTIRAIVATTSSRHYTPLQALVYMNHPCRFSPVTHTHIFVLKQRTHIRGEYRTIRRLPGSLYRCPYL